MVAREKQQQKGDDAVVAMSLEGMVHCISKVAFGACIVLPAHGGVQSAGLVTFHHTAWGSCAL
jgi:hypothetical protein